MLGNLYRKRRLKMNRRVLTQKEIQTRAEVVAARLVADRRKHGLSVELLSLYGVPRGGIPSAYAVQAALAASFPLVKEISVVDDPLDADAIIDDIVDSGATRDKFTTKYNKPFYALVDKLDPESPDFESKDWFVFPWEKDEVGSIEDSIVRLLQYIGEDPTRGGLKETPARVVKAWRQWTQGYHIDPESVLKAFEDGAEKYDEMVIVKDIPVYSHCEHHLAAIFGTATVAYIPDGRIVGLSKLSRLVDVFARRLQVQERLTNQIADALQTHLQPKGVGVVIKARHLCMESRGICKQGHQTITSALRGVLRTKPEARAEFLNLAMG